MKRLILAIRPTVWVAAVAMLMTGIVAAPATTAMAATGCVTETFSISDQNTVLQCVRDEQVLLNNIWSAGIRSGIVGLQQLTVDGQYGPHTQSDVHSFQVGVSTITVDGITGPQTWWHLCSINSNLGFTGAFWHGAGCNTEGPNPPA
jgi:peptidoglycan hydrolase-like protein with peptidoglycan-binding domain